MTDPVKTLPYSIDGRLPLYVAPVPLDPARHHDRAIVPSATPFGFAARTPTARLTIDEFERAMLDYPIVFFGPQRLPVAVMGLQPDANLFVTEDGRFAPGAYVPGYLRRYPFVTASLSEEEAVVCIDEQAACVVSTETEGAVALYDDTEPSAMLRDMVTLVETYAAAEVRTEAFGAVLDEYDLLEPRQAHFTGDDGMPQLLLDYAAVSRGKLAALSPEQLAALRDNGALPAIYAHLFSAANWDKLPIWSA